MNYEGFKSFLNSICIEEEQRVCDNSAYVTYGSTQRLDQRRNKQMHSRHKNNYSNYTNKRTNENQHRQRDYNHNYYQTRIIKGFVECIPYIRIKIGVVINRIQVQ